MPKKFATFADTGTNAKPVSDFDFQEFREKMKNVMRNARRNQARAMQTAKDIWIGR